MKESAERVVRVGFAKNPKRVFDEVEAVTAGMKRDGWKLQESIIEEGLEKIHLFFERESHTIKEQEEPHQKTSGGTCKRKGPVHEIRN
jgi:hypothetical protein